MNSESIDRDKLRLEAIPGRWTGVAAAVTLVGVLAAAGLTATQDHGLERFYRSFLVSFMFALSLALGALFFVLVTHLTRAAWSVALRRIAEVLAWTLLPLTLPALLILTGMHDLYEWSHADAVAEDALLQHKQAWLNPTFFVIRFFFYFAVWNFLAWFFLRRSTQQDRSGDPALTLQMENAAAPGTIFFAMTVTFAVFDWVMSLYPHWYSTMFGVYYFAGCVLGFFSLVTLTVMFLQRSGKLTEVITVEHYHDLGKMIFAFVVFWAYIAFSQYMLIWYANIPEETDWYAVRQHGPWLGVSLLLLFGHFIVPFLWLMSRYMKRRRWVLALGAGWLVAMHWVDLLYLIMPEARPEGPAVTALDLACLVLMLGWLATAALWRLRRQSLVAVGDPRLGESLGLENV